MKILKPARVPNSRALERIAKASHICAPYKDAIFAAYVQYVRGRGRPSKIVPIGLPEDVANELYNFYSSKRVRDELDWIGDYRKAKGLSHCPLCGNPGPSQVEHYLPRSPYAEFTVFSWNLLPSCGLCNGKRGKYGNVAGEKIPLIHPYFDKKVYGEAMLTARIVPPYCAATFLPEALANDDPVLTERAKRQIRVCVNSDRFSEYLEGKWNIWRGKASEYDSKAVLYTELERELRASVGPTGMNSWDAAFLRALLSNAEALTWIFDKPIDISLPN